jgi:O-acetylhomoserine/O-acetylserine sulfhydrylase
MRLKYLVLSLLTTLAYSTQLTIIIPASAVLPNPAILPPSTTGSLSTLSKDYSAPVSSTNAFSFRNVSGGSYLFTTNCATHAFGPLRIDVEDNGTVAAWGTFRGNAWDNKGEMMAVAVGNVIEARAHSAKSYYMERSGCGFSPSCLPSAGTQL